MKKVLYFMLAACFGVMIAACGNKKDQPAGETNADNNTEVSAEQTEQTEAAIVEYEEYAKKYAALCERYLNDEDVFDEIMDLQESVFDISEKLVNTEAYRTEEQKARVAATDALVNEWKQKMLE